jgi:hypothetical protein
LVSWSPNFAINFSCIISLVNAISELLAVSL